MIDEFQMEHQSTAKESDDQDHSALIGNRQPSKLGPPHFLRDGVVPKPNLSPRIGHPTFGVLFDVSRPTIDDLSQPVMAIFF